MHFNCTIPSFYHLLSNVAYFARIPSVFAVSDAEAKPYINEISDAKSVVLFENDLPDHMEAS